MYLTTVHDTEFVISRKNAQMLLRWGMPVVIFNDGWPLTRSQLFLIAKPLAWAMGETLYLQEAVSPDLAFMLFHRGCPRTQLVSEMPEGMWLLNWKPVEYEVRP